MARSVKPIAPTSSNLTPDQMRSAIKSINRRINELNTFDAVSISNRNDPKIESLVHKLDELITGIFPPGTIEYNRYHYSVTNLDREALNFMEDTPRHEVIAGLEEGIASSISTLETIKEIFAEKLDDGDEADTEEGKILRAYQGLDLHPEIDRAASKLYVDGHYANAIEDAVKALNAFVRMRSGRDDLDGTTLMETVFSPKNPVLAFNALSDESDRNEQKGFMMMMSGAVAGLRNPRAHSLIKDHPERT